MWHEVWLVIAIFWFLAFVAGFVFLFWIPFRHGQKPSRVSRVWSLSAVLIGIVVCLYCLDEAWLWLQELIYEPAGNPWQEFVLSLPLWWRRVFIPFVSKLLDPPFELFWAAVALRLYEKQKGLLNEHHPKVG